MAKKYLPAGLLFLLLLVPTVSAKQWREITPLKSTRGDVERLLGKPNQLGRYEIANERVNIWYSDGPCEVLYPGLAKINCECLVAKDTVLRIAVTLESPVRVSKLGIDKNNYQRTPIHAFQPTATYSDFGEGVVYTIRESDDTVTHIDHLPSAKDCDQVLSNQATEQAPNAWRGIAPLRSTRVDVERLLGPAKSSVGNIYRYELPDNRVDITYTANPCSDNANSQGRVDDVVSKIAVSPRTTILVRNLPLDKERYTRVQSDHPENFVQYLNTLQGITVEAMLNNGCEEVVSIVYQPTRKDRELRCGI